jgi:opacity protein-like surface antigen
MKKLILLSVCMFAFAATGFAQSESQTQSATKAQSTVKAQGGNRTQPGNKKYKGEKGVSSIGVMIGYAVDNKSALIGADFRYNIRDRVRLAPSVLYSLKNEYRSTVYVNADAHYLARVTNKITLYPVGGIGLSVWNFDGLIPESLIPESLDPLTSAGSYSETSGSETKTRIGLNLGFGGEMRVTKDIIVGAEFKYNLTSERIYDQAMFLVRAAYYF